MAQPVPSQFVPPLYHSLTLGRNGLPNHPILICSKPSEATAYQEGDGHPCNNLGPVRPSRHNTVHIRNAASLASNISSIRMGDGAYHGFSIVLFDVTYSTLSLGFRGFSSGQLVPDTIVKAGHRYLILHDSGKRAVSFLSSTLKGLIDSGARVIISASSSGWLVGNLSQQETRFDEWKQNGKVIVSESWVGHTFAR